MKKLLIKLFQKFGIKSFKPVQTLDFTLLAGKVSKKRGENLEKN